MVYAVTKVLSGESTSQSPKQAISWLLALSTTLLKSGKKLRKVSSANGWSQTLSSLPVESIYQVNGFSWKPSNQEFCFAICSSSGQVGLFEHNRLDSPVVLQVQNKSLLAVEWIDNDHILVGGLGGLFVLSREDGSWKVEPAENISCEGIRDLKVSPSVLSKKKVFAAVSDDKQVRLLEWTEEGLQLLETIDGGKPGHRASWSFTGQFLYVAQPDEILTLGLDKTRERLEKIN